MRVQNLSFCWCFQYDVKQFPGFTSNGPGAQTGWNSTVAFAFGFAFAFAFSYPWNSVVAFARALALGILALTMPPSGQLRRTRSGDRADDARSSTTCDKAGSGPPTRGIPTTSSAQRHTPPFRGQEPSHSPPRTAAILAIECDTQLFPAAAAHWNNTERSHSRKRSTERTDHATPS
jgi:hypothetical protein